VRIGLFLLLFPSLAFAIGGCPVGVQLGNVTMATGLPVCLKFEASEHGGCLVDCKSVCVELPLANTKGPVETTGTTCSWSDSNGSGNGDADGSGNTPGEGDHSGNGGLPKDWDFFSPVIGDATGTSVSGSIAKINKNLGSALGTLMGTADRTYHSLNEMRGLAQRETNATEKAVSVLEEIREYNKKASNNTEATNLYLSRMEQNQEVANIQLKKLAESSGGSGTGSESGSGDNAKIYNELKQLNLNMFGPDFTQTYGGYHMYALMKSMQYDLPDIKGHLQDINSMFKSFHWNTSQDLLSNSIETNRNIKAIAEAIKNNGGTGGTGGTGGGEGTGGADIDYSKMPGADGNPLSVQEGKYSSSCQGKDCFFDVPAMQKKLDDANKSLTDKYTAISGDVQKVFTFSLSGSADPMECLDLFSHQGKAYSVCPPTGAYWQTLAAIMMFVFYFIALMIIFKR
jgi:hypothetical protein